MPDQTGRTHRRAADEFNAAEFARELALVTPQLETTVGITRDDLASLLLLEGVRGFGPQKFKELHEASLRPIDVLLEPQLLPTAGSRGNAFRTAIAAIDGEARELAQARAVRQLVRAHEHGANIVTYAHPSYPANVYTSNNPIPVLYVHGHLELLTQRRAVACVGSREIGPPYERRHYEFARFAALRGFAVVAGFALGADSVGHRAAFEAGGATTLVMPCGLDRPFPPENKMFFQELARYGQAVSVSEFPFGTAASSLTLRKRNKLIVAFALGVMLSQTSTSGGAMNAYRFALEQRKPIATFKGDGSKRTSGNEQIARGEEPKAGRSAEQQLDPARRATVFSPSGSDESVWGAWLQRLSSST